MGQRRGLAALGVLACPFMCLCWCSSGLGVVAGHGRSSFLCVSSHVFLHMFLPGKVKYHIFGVSFAKVLQMKEEL